MRQQWCYCCGQQDDLLYHMRQAEKFNYLVPDLDVPVYKKVIDYFLNTLQNIY
jgi:hypothetical protein